MYECVIELPAVYGSAPIFAFSFCRDTPWRFSKAIVVSTRGTVFDGAHSVLRDS